MLLLTDLVLVKIQVRMCDPGMVPMACYQCALEFAGPKVGLSLLHH